MPRAHHLCECRYRAASYVEPPVVRVCFPAWIVNSAAPNPQSSEEAVKIREILSVLLCKVRIRFVRARSGDSAFGIEVSAGKVDSFDPRFHLCTLEKGKGELDYVEMPGSAFAIDPRAAAGTNDKLLKKSDIPFFALRDSDRVTMDCAIV